MEEHFQLLIDKIKIEMQNQTIRLANTILEKMVEKLKSVLEEYKILKLKVVDLEKEVEKTKDKIQK